MMLKTGVAEARRRDPNLPNNRPLTTNEYEHIETELKLNMDAIIRPAFADDARQEARFKALIARLFFKGMILIQDIPDFTEEILEQKRNKQPISTMINCYILRVHKAPPQQPDFTSPQKDTNQVIVRHETFV